MIGGDGVVFVVVYVKTVVPVDGSVSVTEAVSESIV